MFTAALHAEFISGRILNDKAGGDDGFCRPEAGLPL
jgi:hypothetical protein